MTGSGPRSAYYKANFSCGGLKRVSCSSECLKSVLFSLLHDFQPSFFSCRGTFTSPCDVLDLYHYHDDDEDDYLVLVTKIDPIVFGTKIDALATPAGTSTFFPLRCDDYEDDYLDAAAG